MGRRVWCDGPSAYDGGETGLDGQLRVTAGGLRVLASHCEALPEQLTRSVASNVSMASGQASGAAVSTCDERIAAAVAALTEWSSAMASTLSASASAYERADAGSAAELGTTVL